MPLTTDIRVQVACAHRGTADLATPSVDLSWVKTIALANGNAANQANALWHDQRTIAASANDDLDLAGVLVDAFGAVLTFTKIKGLFVAAAAANTNDVLVGGLGTNGFFSWLGATGDLVKVGPGGLLALVRPDNAGYAVTAATADLLRVTNGAGGTSVVYDIVLVGVV